MVEIGRCVVLTDQTCLPLAETYVDLIEGAIVICACGDGKQGR